MKFYNLPSKFGRRELEGAAGIGVGPKHSKILVVRGLDKSPSPLKYFVPPAVSTMRKSFGLTREKCIGVIRGDKTADKIVPGPGTYIKDLVTS